jgi:hypothetical protein
MHLKTGSLDHTPPLYAENGLFLIPPHTYARAHALDSFVAFTLLLGGKGYNIMNLNLNSGKLYVYVLLKAL